MRQSKKNLPQCETNSSASYISDISYCVTTNQMRAKTITKASKANEQLVTKSSLVLVRSLKALKVRLIMSSVVYVKVIFRPVIVLAIPRGNEFLCNNVSPVGESM